MYQSILFHFISIYLLDMSLPNKFIEKDIFLRQVGWEAPVNVHFKALQKKKNKDLSVF